MPLQATSGAASYDAFGGGVPVVPAYIEEVFSTWLYTGNGSTQTITNGIDLSTKGGLVWLKNRSSTLPHNLFDTVRGRGNYLLSNTADAQNPYGADAAGRGLSTFNSDGFSLGINQGSESNSSGQTYVSWTFRKQPKFFDVVTWTGSGSSGQVIPHSLGVQPKVIICKCTSSASNWQYNDANDKYLLLNSTAASASSNRDGGWIPQYNATATTLTTQDFNGNSNVNASGETYVAYLFASNAGGFGLTGTDNVISCGSFTAITGTVSVNLGYEPQWILTKPTGAGQWRLFDTMRGWNMSGNDAKLRAESADAEDNSADAGNPTATGFDYTAGSGEPYIYIAIRRGPMKVPTDATKVFAPVAYTGNGNTGITVSSLTSPVDLAILSARNAQSPKMLFSDRLRGSGTGENSGNMRTLTSTSTVAESNSSLNGYYATLDYQNSIRLLGSSSGIYNGGSVGYVLYSMKRAPSFFDEVCYSRATAGAVSHNLGVAPELIIYKARNTADNWAVYSAPLGVTQVLKLNTTAAAASDGTDYWGSTPPSSTSIYAGAFLTYFNYVAYLFATCPGVSKVGSYIGNGTTQTINCGFGAGGARFVLIKRTDSTGDWYVYDTARGMTTLTDPYLLLNTTDAETATLGSVTTVSTGFAVNASILAAINTNAASYLFLAIA